MAVLLISFLIVTIIIGIVASRKENSEGFLIGNRELNTFQSVMTLCGSFIGAMTLLVYPAFVFTYGISSMWIFIGFLLGYIFFSYFASHLKRYKPTKHFYTMTDYFNHRFGGKVATCVISIIFITYFGGLTAQIVGSGKILAELSGLTYKTSVMITVGIMLTYIIFGGFKSVVTTDVFQFIVLGILVLIITFAIKTRLNVPIIHLNPFHAGPIKILAFLLLGILGPFGGQSYWQKVYAMKDEKTAKQAFVISGVIICLVGSILTYIGLIARTRFPLLDPDLAIMYSFTRLVPNGLNGLVSVAFFAAVLSSADTNLFMLGLNFTNDILRLKEKKRFYTRLSIACIGIVSLFLALKFTNLVDLAIVIKSIGFILPSIVLFLWLTKGDTTAIICSIILTFILVIAFALGGFIRPELAIIALFGSIIFYWGTAGIKKMMNCR